jgi:hypothetical protein
MTFDLLQHFSITFDESRHLYARNGEKIDGVTSVIPYLEGNDFLDKNPGVMERAGERGHRVAKFIELAEDALSVKQIVSLPPNSAPAQWARWLQDDPACEGYLRFKRDTGFTARKFPHGGQIASELFVYHPTLGYAGRLDIAGELPLTKMKGPGLIEVKASAEIPKTVGWQAAAYLEAFNKNAHLYELPKLKWRACLHLNPAKYRCGYRLEPLTDPNDFSSFACLLGAHRLARRLSLSIEFKPIADNGVSDEAANAATPSEVFA